MSELEEGGIESLLPSARDGHGNNIYFSHGDDENVNSISKNDINDNGNNNNNNNNKEVNKKIHRQADTT